MTTEDYRKSHTAKGYGEFYDKNLFTEGEFAYEMWKKERKILEDIVSRYCNGGRYLDFACGTGRVLSLLENKFDESYGLDISKEMLSVAEGKVNKAHLVCGDATNNPDIVPGKFDCITAFRFFLNAQDELRHSVLDFIVKKLNNDDSIFIFNIHGNKYSTRWFLVMFDRLFNISRQNQMSMSDIKKMLEPHGMEIIEYHGVGFIYKVFYKYMPKKLWHFIENLFESLKFLKPFSLYFIFVCKKAKS